MKTTFYTAGGQQILLSPPLRDFRHPRRAQVSARCGTPPNPEFGHPSFKNSTKFNNRYVKLRSVVGGVVSSGLDSCFVSKRHKGWGYVNILQQIEAQMQCGRGVSPMPLVEKRRETVQKTVKITPKTVGSLTKCEVSNKVAERIFMTKPATFDNRAQRTQEHAIENNHVMRVTYRAKQINPGSNRQHNTQSMLLNGCGNSAGLAEIFTVHLEVGFLTDGYLNAGGLEYLDLVFVEIAPAKEHFEYFNKRDPPHDDDLEDAVAHVAFRIDDGAGSIHTGVGQHYHKGVALYGGLVIGDAHLHHAPLQQHTDGAAHITHLAAEVILLKVLDQLGVHADVAQVQAKVLVVDVEQVYLPAAAIDDDVEAVFGIIGYTEFAGHAIGGAGGDDAGWYVGAAQHFGYQL